MKRTIIKFARKLGIDLQPYTPGSSNVARMQRIFSHHKIDLVFDVGANRGQYAQLLREFGYAGRIVSFEPLSSAHAQLIAASRKDPLWGIAPRTAIGDIDGEIAINISKNSVSSSILPMLAVHRSSAPESEYYASETVKLSKLDTIAPAYMNESSRSIYLKIDVQGFESQVLAGASQTLASVKGLQLELSLVPLYEGEPLFRDLLDKLDKLGYDLHAVVPGFTDMKSGRLLQLDGIFFQKSAPPGESAAET